MKAISFLIIVFLTPMVVLLNFRLLIFNQNFYEKEFKKLAEYSRIEPNTAREETKKLIAYFCCGKELNEAFFTQREITHLADVKILINSANTMLYFYLALIVIVSSLLIYRKKPKLLFAAAKTASLTGIAFLSILFVASVVNFNFIFASFHLISFDNDFWLLPQEANLIKLFPQRFFQDFANLIALKSFIMLSGAYFLSVYFLNKRK